MIPEPNPGETVFLVSGRCEAGCGVWMALPEGAYWPVCPRCGADVRPTRRWGSAEDPSARGFVAHEMQELDALEQVDVLRRAVA